MSVTQRLPIILHAHLFKNAGTTLDWALARSFGAAFLDHRDDDAMRGNPAYLAALIDEWCALSALSSHWLPLPVVSTARRAVYPIVLLRDPVLRMASVYAFERRQAVEHPGTQRARTATFRDYVAWRLSPQTGPVLRNYQLRMLSGTYPGTDDQTQAEAARSTLAALPVIGLVERFDETMVLLEHWLGELFPTLDLAYVAQNVTGAGPRQDAEARAEVEVQLGELREQALAANRGDDALYREARERFAAQWAALPDAERRLEAFRARCRVLDAAASSGSTVP